MSEMTLEYGLLKPTTVFSIKSSSDEIGAYIPVMNEGKLVMAASEQIWFWSEEWQAGERSVDNYIRDGEILEYDTMEEFLRTLRE